MEGVPRISMMSFPLRKSADAPSFKPKLKAYIRDEYKEDGESYNTEIHELESLRAGAMHISKDFSGCSTLKKYFCQLNFLRTRFPMSEGCPCAITFSWHDVFSETVHGWADVEFEMSCILFNIGALHSELGATDNRQTADGMKNACTHFQCAAWAFQQMRHNYQNFFTQDISPDTLSIMTNICLAQAQECILEKSLIDNRKSTITAKVALQIVEYYQLALKTCDQMNKDAGQYSDKVIKAVKKWKKLIELKSHYYSSISLLYRGLQAEDESKYGDRVTFYKAALEKLNEAAKCAKSLDKTDNAHDTIQFTFDVVQGKVAISERENEFVYHEKVPELSAISSEIKGVSLVKGIPFKFDDPQIAGPDIFGRLVPIEAHEVSSLYSEEKAKILRHYSGKIEGKNETLDKMIIALQLDQIDLQSTVKKIPQELVDCCAALSVNKDAVKRLADSMSKLSGMFHDVEGNLGEIEDILKEDEVKEKEHYEIMGTKRPPSNVILELIREVQKYRNAHSVAAETNQALHEALSKHVGNLQILMKPFDEVMKHIPAFEDDDQGDQEAIAQMKKLIGKVDEMRKQRITLENQLRESIHSDDITNKIVIKVESDLMELFREELKKHDKVTQILDQNLLAQDNIIRALTEANANYAETRKKTVKITKRRDKVIEDLISSYESYDELLNKCNKGIEFYTKLDTNVQKLLQRVRSVCKVQEEERESSIKTLINKTKAMNFNNMSNLPPTVPNMGTNMNMGYMPRPVTSFQDNFSASSGSSNATSQQSSGHLKLKDVLAMKKQPQQAQPPSSNAVANIPYAQVQNQHPQQNQPFYQPSHAQAPISEFYNPADMHSSKFSNIESTNMTTAKPSTPTNFPGLSAQTITTDQYSKNQMPVMAYQQQPPLQQPQLQTPYTYATGQAQGQDRQFCNSNSTIPATIPVPHQSTFQQPPQQPQTNYGYGTGLIQTQYHHNPTQPINSNSNGIQNQMQVPISGQTNQSQPQYHPTNGTTSGTRASNETQHQNQVSTSYPQYQMPQQQCGYQPGHPNPIISNPSTNGATNQTYPNQSTYAVNPNQVRQPPTSVVAQTYYGQGQGQYYPPAPAQEYNPNDSFLAKYVKQHMGSTNSSKNSTSTNNTPTSFLGLSSATTAFSNTAPQHLNQNPTSSYSNQQQQPTVNTSQYGYQGQSQYQYPGYNSNGGTNNQSQMPQQQNYYASTNNQQQTQQIPPSQQQTYYGQPQQGSYYSQQQQPPPPPQKQTGGNIDLLSDIDMSCPLTQPLTPTVIPNSNQENQS